MIGALIPGIGQSLPDGITIQIDRDGPGKAKLTVTVRSGDAVRVERSVHSTDALGVEMLMDLLGMVTRLNPKGGK
jgi:hypothetical protein